MNSTDAAFEGYLAVVRAFKLHHCVTLEEAAIGMKVLSKAMRTVIQEQGRIEVRTIWFWERDRYEHEGWLVRHPKGGFDHCFRPLALRIVHD